MRSNLSPETLAVLERARRAAQEVPFDPEALLAEVNAQAPGGSASPTPQAASHTARPPTSGWYSKFGVLQVGLAALGVGGLLLTLHTSQPTAGARSEAPATTTTSSPAAPSPAAPVPTLVSPSMPDPVEAPAAATRPVAESTPPPPRQPAVRRPTPRFAALAAHAPRPSAPTATPVADPDVTPAATPSQVVPDPPPPTPPSDPFALELELLDRAERSLSDGQARAALDTLADLIERNPAGQLVPEAMAAQVRAHCALRDTRAAAAIARRLIARAPHSVAAGRVRSTCAGDPLGSAP
jgi:hypothetical protein